MPANGTIQVIAGEDLSAARGKLLSINPFTGKAHVASSTYPYVVGVCETNAASAATTESVWVTQTGYGTCIAKDVIAPFSSLTWDSLGTGKAEAQSSGEALIGYFAPETRGGAVAASSVADEEIRVLLLDNKRAAGSLIVTESVDAGNITTQTALDVVHTLAAGVGVAGDSVSVSCAALTANLVVSHAYFSDTAEVTFRLGNPSTGDINPGALDFTFTISPATYK